MLIFINALKIITVKKNRGDKISKTISPLVILKLRGCCSIIRSSAILSKESRGLGKMNCQPKIPNKLHDHSPLTIEQRYQKYKK